MAIVRRVLVAIVVCSALVSPAAQKRTLTPKDLAKLRAVALSTGIDDPIPADVAHLFGLVKTPAAVPSKRLIAKDLRPDGTHFVNVVTTPGADAVFFVTQKPGIIHLYLTDSTLVLRAAGIMERSGNRLITNDEAAEGYQGPLQVWSELTAGLR